MNKYRETRPGVIELIEPGNRNHNNNRNVEEIKRKIDRFLREHSAESETDELTEGELDRAIAESMARCRRYWGGR